MVPGSTLIYGSNFWMVTRSPRSTRRRPSDAAAMPFPREDTTPPVTNTNLVCCMLSASLRREGFSLCRQPGFGPLEIVHGIDGRQRAAPPPQLAQQRYADLHAVPQGP